MIDISQYIDRLEKLKSELHKEIENSGPKWQTAIGVEVVSPDTFYRGWSRSYPIYMMFPSGIAMEIRFYYYKNYLHERTGTQTTGQ